MAESRITGKDGGWSFHLGNQESLCNDLDSSFDWEYGRLGKLAMRWFLRGVRSCSGTKLQNDVNDVLLRQGRQKRALWTEVVAEDEKGSLQSELNHWNSFLSGKPLTTVVFEILQLSPLWHRRLFSTFKEPSDHSCFHGCFWTFREMKRVRQTGSVLQVS